MASPSPDSVTNDCPLPQAASKVRSAPATSAGPTPLLAVQPDELASV